ncbi:unnamed protein product [Pleuronectes platessa]|uniref:Uncharacterized protein n=1 Tax=Pleuronectes platessa TaxID=8262 RepID=A0A9N7YIG5_PLEPL|nr:unnamed protein product [Pleuronectes platessa]
MSMRSDYRALRPRAQVLPICILIHIRVPFTLRSHTSQFSGTGQPLFYGSPPGLVRLQMRPPVCALSISARGQVRRILTAGCKTLCAGQGRGRREDEEGGWLQERRQLRETEEGGEAGCDGQRNADSAELDADGSKTPVSVRGSNGSPATALSLLRMLTPREVKCWEAARPFKESYSTPPKVL